MWAVGQRAVSGHTYVKASRVGLGTTGVIHVPSIPVDSSNKHNNEDGPMMENI